VPDSDGKPRAGTPFRDAGRGGAPPRLEPSNARRRGARLRSWRILGPKDHLPTLTDPFSPATEQYRMLRSRLGSDIWGGRRLRVLGVSSALPGDGKTSTALNIAIAAAQEVGRTVAYVECDLRRQRLRDFLAEPPAAGLTEALEGSATIEDVLLPMDRPENLTLISAGGVPSNPVELLGSKAMAQAVSWLREHHDLVIVDTPPALYFADASELSACIDAYLLVARAGVTPRAALLETYRLLSSRGIVGVVLNGLRPTPGTSYRYAYHGYYAAAREKGGKPT
jgi:capsular exopolysaccharide synthesis family protein